MEGLCSTFRKIAFKGVFFRKGQTVDAQGGAINN